MMRFLLVTLLSLMSAMVTVAAIGRDDIPRVRTIDRQIRALLDEGLAHSPSLRALVGRLARGDVVVYLRCARLSSRLDGQLTFVSAAGGFRYVLVHLAIDRPWARQIATLGHELQHAVEIAERPDVVDQAALARAYTHIGFVQAGNATRAQVVRHDGGDFCRGTGPAGNPSVFDGGGMTAVNAADGKLVIVTSTKGSAGMSDAASAGLDRRAPRKTHNAHDRGPDTHSDRRDARPRPRLRSSPPGGRHPAHPSDGTLSRGFSAGRRGGFANSQLRMERGS